MDRPVPVIVHMVRWRAASVHRPEAESVGLYACRFRVLVGLRQDLLAHNDLVSAGAGIAPAPELY